MSLPPGLAGAILDAAPIGVTITTGGLEEPSPRMVYVNPAFLSVTGHTAGELIGHSPRVFQGPLSSRRVLSRLRDALRTRSSFEGETYNHRANGTAFLMRWTVSPLPASTDDDPCFFAFQEDISQQRRNESVAAAAHLMENIANTFSGFRAELVAPLAEVEALTERIQQGVDSLPREEISELLDQALGELGRVEYLLQALRSFNMFEETKVEPTNTAIYFQRFSTLVAADIAARGVGLEVALAESAPPEVDLDGRALHQILLVLVTNALESLVATIPARGERRITLAVAGGTPGVWTVRIADSGPGVEAEDIDRIFAPFFSTKRGAVGLGLSFARQLAVRLGGSLELDRASDPEERSTFVCTLPVGTPLSRR